MTISTAAKEYLVEIEVRKFTPKTIRNYRNKSTLSYRADGLLATKRRTSDITWENER